MKKLFALLAAVLCCAQMQAHFAEAQNIEGQIIAAQYGTWKVPGTTPNTYAFTPTSCRVQGGASFFFPFAVGTPVAIVDQQPTLTEIVTPTAYVDTNVTCAISVAPVNAHQGFYMTSATGGLQEALTNNLTAPATNTVVLSNAWYQQVAQVGAVPATVIANAKGSTQLGLVDVTTVPSTWYAWNGSQYLAVPLGGGSAGNLGTLQNDLLANNSNNTAAIDLYDFQANSTYLPTTALVQAANHAGMVTLLPGSPGGFTNTSNGGLGVKVDDKSNLGASYRSVTEFGAWCDTRQNGVSINSGSTVLTIYGGFFYPADIGKTVTVVGTIGGVPTAYETKIAAMGSGTGPGYPTAIVTTAAPATFGAITTATIGHDDTAAIASGLAAVAINQQSGANYFQSLQFPGGNCLSHAILYNGVSMTGLNGIMSAISGFPGEDVFAEPDPASGVQSEGNGVHIHDLTWNVDNRIDATHAWQIVDDAGTHAKTAVYRPTGINTAWSNNPRAPGWFLGSGPNGSGAINGVASVTDGSTLICIPSTLSVPAVGNKIVFPYLSTVFTATIASAAGSCSAGNTARTLSSAIPTGSTGTQVEWFAGTSPQTINATVSGGSCPASITLTNSILPSPAGESNVAPFGLIKIDGEEFTYFGKTAAGTLGSNYLTITGCAQNGTTRAAHSSGATVVPLNPFKPTTPYPVFPTVNGNATTPTQAAFYPAWNVGNAAFAAPDSDGNQGLAGIGSFANSILNSLYITSWPSSAAVNNTAGFYMVGLPYSTAFNDITIFQTTFGIHEGTPSFNTGGTWANAQPTADGTHWENIRISACNVSDLISGGQNSFKDWNTYSQCYAGSGTVGANTCFLFTQGWNDQGGYAQSIQGSIDLHNMYCEPEGGSQYGLTPVFEWDLSTANWDNLHMGGGGETYIGGNNQTFHGGNFNNQALFPAINYGSNNGSDGTYWLAWLNGVGNVYGTNSFINYGPNAHFSGATSKQNQYTSPYGAQQLGNSREPWHGQTNETFNTGNTTAPYVNSNGGYIPAWEFNVNGFYEASGFTVPWAWDGTSPSGGSVGCALSTDGAAACFSYLFNQAGIQIGPGQRLAAGKYVMHVSSKSTGAATSYQIKVGACNLGDVATVTVPVSSSWPAPDTSAIVDFTGHGTCTGGAAASLSLDFIYASPAADTISVAYVDFAPVAENFTATTINATTINLPGGSPTGGSSTGCSQSPVVGINGGFSCPTLGGLANLAASQGTSDTTASVASVAGLSTAGCFYVDSEYECYTGITGTTLTGISRGAYTTTVATHSSGASLTFVSLVLGSVLSSPVDVVAAGGGSTPTLLGLNNPFPQTHGNSAVLDINQGGYETYIDRYGNINQTNTGGSNLLTTTTFGYLSVQPAVTNSGYLLQTNGPNTAYQPLTLGGGHAGTLNVVATPNIAAPTVLGGYPTGSTTISYVCSGTDFDGNAIPGTTLTIANGAASWAFPTGYEVHCPWSAGINTQSIWRTAGGVNQGLLGSGSGPGFFFRDYGGSSSGGTPPATNLSNPKLSIAGTGTPSMQLGPTNISTGTGAPTSTCGTAPIGSGSLWLRTDGGASTSLYSCAGTTWTAVTIP